MSRLVRYILGLILIIAALCAILVWPPDVKFYLKLQHLGFLGRALSILVLCSALCLYRIIKGPTASDRIVAIDMFGILIIGFCGLLTVSTNRNWYIDIAIAWALQSFISTLALAKYLEGKDFDE